MLLYNKELKKKFRNFLLSLYTAVYIYMTIDTYTLQQIFNSHITNHHYAVY